MKLNDFKQKSPIITKRSTRTVINVNNDRMENKYLEQISELNTQIETLQKQLETASPFKAAYNETLDNYHNILSQFQEAERQLSAAQQALSSNQDKLKGLEDLKQKVTDAESFLRLANQEKQQLSTEYNDLLRQKTNLEVNKTEYLQVLNQQADMLTTLNTGIEEAHNVNNQLQEQIDDLNNELNPLKQEHPKLKRDNFDLNHQLGVEKNRNKDAIAKIEELEYLKLQLNDWTKNLTSEIKDTDSKKSAYQKTLKKKDKILAEVTKEVSELLQDREELQSLVQYYKEEALKPRYGGGFGEVREAQIPLARDAVKRQYLGLGKPTLLKFKREDKNDNEE